MHRRGLVFGVVLLLLASCVQMPQKAADGPSQTADEARRQQIIAEYMAHMPPTHPSGQDLTYNAQFRPHFPKEAIAAGHYGTVTLLIFVNANGETGEIRVERSSGYPELDASAIETAKHWLYMPEAKNGIPQSSWVRTPVAFSRPVPSPPSTDSLQVGVATEADARTLLGKPAGVMRYTNGMTDMIWGDKSVGAAILRFDAVGKLLQISRTSPASAQ
jgi:TonB family protein